MFGKLGKGLILLLMVLNGLLFISNIYVWGNTEAALAMHEDLAPWAGAAMANLKVLDCFIVGLLYLVTAYAIFRGNRVLSVVGVLAFLLFDGFYLVELALWGATHPPVWFGFGLFGSLSFGFAVFSWYVFNHSPQAVTA